MRSWQVNSINMAIGICGAMVARNTASTWAYVLGGVAVLLMYIIGRFEEEPNVSE